MTFDFDLFVIGGGSAGVRCGRIAAAHGARVGVAEGRFWGGTCVNIGCVPKKILVQAAEYGAHAEDAAGFGWRGAAPGAHDWAALIAAKDREITRLNGIYRRLLDGAGAKIFEAHARFLDAHRIAVGDQVVSAERIVIATGGRPLRPAIPGAALGIVSDDAFYLDQRPDRVVILGSGYIAVEFAGIFRGLGAEVDLVFRQPLPLRGFDRDLREAMAEALVAQGVRLFPESNIAEVEAMGAGRVAVLADGRRIAADCVFFASGRGANTEGLGLARAGVATSAGGAVVIGEQWRTNVAHIFAIGDVTDRLNLTPVATAEGHALADLLFAGEARPRNFAAVATAVFSTPPLATVGLSEEEAQAWGKADIYLSRFTPMRHTISGRARKTLVKLVVDHASGRVLGAHMFGEDAPEIMQGIAVALTCGATKAEFDQTIGIHPTAAEEFVTLRQITRSVGGA